MPTYPVYHTILLLLVLSLSGCASLRKPQSIPAGAGSFVFQQKKLNYGRPLTVLTYRPKNYNRDSPILFVIHGASRAAESYHAVWSPIAEQYNALLVVPYFDKEAGFLTSDQFNLGNVFQLDSMDQILGTNPEPDWSFSLLEPLFDVVRKKTENRSREYCIYGHSAGSQFLHRFLIFKEKNRVKRAVCANAGWYTTPDDQIRFPYGLAGTPLDAANLRAAFGKRVTILLGEADTKTTGASLRQSPEAMRQGRHRFERGHSFFDYCQRLAEAKNFSFNWDLQTVAGAGHSNEQMAEKAGALLFFGE